MRKIKPETEWRHNVSVLQGRCGGGQIRWKGARNDGRHRFLVLLEKRPGKPDHFYRSQSVTGSVEEAVAILDRLQEAFDSGHRGTANPIVVASDGQGRRKHPRLVEAGRESARRYWEEQYAELLAEAPPRPSAPSGLPSLKPRIKTRSGRVIDTAAPVWKVDSDFAGRRRQTLNIDRLYRPWNLDGENQPGRLAGLPRRTSVFSLELIHAMVLFVARTLEKHTGSHVSSALTEFFQLEAFLAREGPERLVGPADLTARRYRAFVRGANPRGALPAFYRWCVGQGFTGYESRELLRIRQIPVPGSVKGKAIRSRDPRKGALTWEEQQLLVRALANPADATHPRDRLIVWLFQELGSRPSAIGGLRNRHLEPTPLGDAYILHVPRVKQSSPVNDTVPRKISRFLGDLIRSLREGGDDDFLIPGELESGWAGKACRAFVVANNLYSPRLRRAADDGTEGIDRLPLTGYRLRYTMATNLAEQGASPEQIAAMLDDRTLAMALVYTNNTSELVDILEETLDRHPAWLRHLHMFLGRVGGGEERRMLPVIQGGVPYFDNYEKYADRVREIGWCSNPDPCVLRPPLACYRCSWFLAHPDPGVHVQQLDQLKDEVRSKVGIESDRMAKVLRPDMFAVAEVVSLTRGGRTAAQRIESKIARDGGTQA